MCLFPIPNTNYTSLAYKKGIYEFDCGACPECLQKRASRFALQSVYEARAHAFNCMVTLTYDNFVRDSVTGRILGETPVNPDLKVNVRDIQLFIKRLRKYFFGSSKSDMKYMACAEYGSRTHRAHYHLLLFGVRFPDYHFYKKSKRGNPIYMSSILTNLWKHGICTIDCLNVQSAVSRYCTKYCAKSRSDKTFTLRSQGIGLRGLVSDFNGLSYFVDGREYPVPRSVWEYYIVSKYQNRYLHLKNVPFLSPKYVNRNKALTDFDEDLMFELSKKSRSFYRKVRDRDPFYIRYLSYWQNKGQMFDLNKLPVLNRIYLLNDSKFHFYKIAALDCYFKRKRLIPFPGPGSNCVSYYERYRFNLNKNVYGRYIKFKTCPSPSRLNRASDTGNKCLIPIFEKSPFLNKNFQNSIDI